MPSFQGLELQYSGENPKQEYFEEFFHEAMAVAAQDMVSNLLNDPDGMDQ